jgi:Na+/proline symporter
MVLVNLLFVSLGVLLFHYATTKGIALPDKTDALFPTLALSHLGNFAAIVFVIGLTAATFSSADSVLTTLTTSLCIDILGTETRNDLIEAQRTSLRHKVHVGFAILLWLVILVFPVVQKKYAVIDAIFTLASYTYGPLLGLFAFGLFAESKANDRLVPAVCVVSPLICLVLQKNSAEWFHGYKMGFELLILNGLLTFAGLWLIRFKTKAAAQ